MRYGYRMPLKFRETGLVLSPHEIRKDCTACSGEWAVGYIYREAPEERGGEPRTWFWSLHGVSGKPADIRGHGAAPTLEAAQADLEANWQKWLSWAGLKEIALDGS